LWIDRLRDKIIIVPRFLLINIYVKILKARVLKAISMSIEIMISLRQLTKKLNNKVQCINLIVC